jgi:hypothetical protein
MSSCVLGKPFKLKTIFFKSFSFFPHSIVKLTIM